MSYYYSNKDRKRNFPHEDGTEKARAIISTEKTRISYHFCIEIV